MFSANYRIVKTIIYVKYRILKYYSLQNIVF